MKSMLYQISAFLSVTIVCVVFTSTEVCGELRAGKMNDVEKDTYFVLGMLEEYGLRKTINASDRLESFYWGEQFHGYVMAAYLGRIGRILEFDNDLEIKRKQDLLVILHSRRLSEYLLSFYSISNNPTKTMSDDEWRKRGFGNLDYTAFVAKSDTIKYAYLAGAYFRWGLENRYRYTNGQKKAELTSRLLEDLGCSSPAISVKEGIPSSVFVDFTPTKELLDWIHRYPEDWAIEIVDSVVGKASDEEIAIYRLVISALQNGMIEDCFLSVPCHVSRLSQIFGDGDTNIPELHASWQEALDDHNERRTDFVSLINLESDSIHVHNVLKNNDDGCSLMLTRIGFSKQNDHAVAIVAFSCGMQENCGSRVALFLNKFNGEWEIMNYSIHNREVPKWCK
jgi:hypothetical protein